MGDAADDAWSSGFEQDIDEQNAIFALRRKCRFRHRCQARIEYNEDGLLECQQCGAMTDI